MDIVIVGVGGQGILTSSMILAKAAMKAGLNVVSSEVHGMAQRGGSVEVHVRIGDVLSPLIPPGNADVMIALEPVEALRFSKYLNENSVVIVNTRKIVPITVNLGMADYPDLDTILKNLRSVTEGVYPVNASEIAESLGAIQATNVVVLGMLAKLVELPFSYEYLEEAVKDVLPPKLHEMNLKALKAGYDAI